jgi:type IV secretion system protein VirB9
MPSQGENGKVVFLYGAALPTVICSPLYVCDIELQPGEVITRDGLIIGDPVRWLVTPGLSGGGSSQVTHIFVKPKDYNLVTSLIVTTNMRAYHIKLFSSDENWMPKVGFMYETDVEKEWDSYYQKTSKKLSDSAPSTSQKVASENILDFDYEISGRASWKPVRVYNDGQRTYIEMPKDFSQGEAPIFNVISVDGANQIVNYRLKGKRYIVDQIFKKAILAIGVGDEQTKVTIEHRRK